MNLCDYTGLYSFCFAGKSCGFFQVGNVVYVDWTSLLGVPDPGILNQPMYGGYGYFKIRTSKIYTGNDKLW